VSAPLLLPDGKTLALGGAGEAVVLFDIEKRKIVARLAGDEKYPSKFPKGFKPESGAEFRIYSEHATAKIAASPDGKRLAVSTSGGWLSVWDVAARKRLWHDRDGDNSSGNIGPHLSMSFSPDGETLATIATGSQDIRFHAAKSGKQRFAVTRRAEMFAHYLPDGSMILDRRFVWQRSGGFAPHPYGRFGFTRWRPADDAYWEMWDYPDHEDAPKLDLSPALMAVSANGHVVAHYGQRQGLVAYDLTRFWPRR